MGVNVFSIHLIVISLLGYQSITGNDPTRPKSLSESKVILKNKKVKQPLTAIFTKNNKRIAIIENTIYERGDFYRGSRIINITSNKVVLRSKSGIKKLTLIDKIKSY